jgi:hypothetical protein
MPSARETFRSTYGNSRNPLTDNVIRYGWRTIDGKRYAYELSSGTFLNAPIYGVSVVEADKTKRHDLSDALFTHAAAEEYIAAGFCKDLVDVS